MEKAKLKKIIKRSVAFNKKKKNFKKARLAGKTFARNKADANKKKENELPELKESKQALIKTLKDLQKAKKKAEEERDKTMAIFTNFTDGLLLFDKKNRIAAINFQTENFLNVKYKEIKGKTVSELFDLPVIGLLARDLGKEAEVLSKRGLEIRKNLFLEISGVSMMKKGKKWATLVILHDITREKMVEKTKTEFVSIAAHQLRTPLSAIKWTLKMFLDGELGPTTAEQKDYLLKTYRTNNIMIGLINDLLNVAKIEEGKFLYNLVLLNMESVIDFAIDSYKEEINKKKIEIIFNKPKNKIPDVLADAEKIKLVMQNLLDNAIKYTLAGGRIIITMAQKNGELEIAVADNGIGIAPEQRNRIFTKFFRSLSAIKLETDGTGLGLFIAKNIVEAHKGKIWFDSETGKGAVFYFTLPIGVEKNK